VAVEDLPTNNDEASPIESVPGASANTARAGAVYFSTALKRYFCWG
jgi:hypothetical protein